MVLKILLKSKFSGRSPEASGALRQIVLGLPLGVGQPGQHPGGGLPGNSAVSVQKAHGVTRCFEFAKDLGDQVGFSAVGGLISNVFVFDIDPKSQNS